MKKWYLKIDHVPTAPNGSPEGPGVAWIHGVNGSYIPEEDFSTDWLSKHGFKTRAAAIRSAYKAKERYKDTFWDVRNIGILCDYVPDNELRYVIRKCYMITILDSEDNAVGDDTFCFGSKEYAIKMAERELKYAMKERGERE